MSLSTKRTTNPKQTTVMVKARLVIDDSVSAEDIHNPKKYALVEPGFPSTVQCRSTGVLRAVLYRGVSLLTIMTNETNPIVGCNRDNNPKLFMVVKDRLISDVAGLILEYLPAGEFRVVSSDQVRRGGTSKTKCLIPLSDIRTRSIALHSWIDVNRYWMIDVAKRIDTRWFDSVTYIAKTDPGPVMPIYWLFFVPFEYL